MIYDFDFHLTLVCTVQHAIFSAGRFFLDPLDIMHIQLRHRMTDLSGMLPTRQRPQKIVILYVSSYSFEVVY